MPTQVTKLLKRVVAVIAIALIVLATTWLLAFTTYRMDGRMPPYSVSVYHSETNNAPLTVNERKIKGKVIRLLGSPIKSGAP